MLELSIIHRPGICGLGQNLGRILEAMLYYDRVHLMMSGQMFSGLWDILGPDDLAALLGHPTITTTLTPEMLGIKNEIGPAFVTHRPVAIKFAGRDGKMIHDKDDAGTLLHVIAGLPNRPDGTRAQINKLLRMTKRSRYAKMLGGEHESRQRLVSLIKDPATLKLFVRGWAVKNQKSVNEAALNLAQIDVFELGEEFMIASSIPLEQMVLGWNPTENWGTILGSVQDYAIDLYLSNAHSADIVTSPDISEIASARVDLSLQRSLNSSSQISAFEEMVFEDAHGFADAVNDGLISFAEALKVVDQSRRFRGWTTGLAPDADLIHEYHRAVTKDTILKSLPASLARFTFFNGAGLVADAALGSGTGLIASAIDTFIVEKLFGGWRPNVFVQNIQKTLSKAEQRAIERGRSVS
ncbi:hypothetical protein [Erythrobacter sp.]|uniref:hypothetical protein n=1 Tax=Erythrobacter sp. TaxID=1042 RepID=UPI0025CC3922|nr:hypothetical protein [Erythrobacter sp.]